MPQEDNRRDCGAPIYISLADPGTYTVVKLGLCNEDRHWKVSEAGRCSEEH